MHRVIPNPISATACSVDWRGHTIFVSSWLTWVQNIFLVGGWGGAMLAKFYSQIRRYQSWGTGVNLRKRVSPYSPKITVVEVFYLFLSLFRHNFKCWMSSLCLQLFVKFNLHSESGEGRTIFKHSPPPPNSNNHKSSVMCGNLNHQLQWPKQKHKKRNKSCRHPLPDAQDREDSISV